MTIKEALDLRIRFTFARHASSSGQTCTPRSVMRTGHVSLVERWGSVETALTKTCVSAIGRVCEDRPRELCCVRREDDGRGLTRGRQCEYGL